MPYYCAPLPTLMMPPATPPLHILKNMMQGGPPPPLPVNVSTSYSCQNGGPLTPPMQSSSPLINNIANENGLPPHLNPLAFINVVPAGQRIIGSEMKMKRLSVDGLFGIIKKEKCKNMCWFALFEVRNVLWRTSTYFDVYLTYYDVLFYIHFFRQFLTYYDMFLHSLTFFFFLLTLYFLFTSFYYLFSHVSYSFFWHFFLRRRCSFLRQTVSRIKILNLLKFEETFTPIPS